MLYASTCTKFVFMIYHSGLHSFPALTLLRQKWIGKDTFIIIIINIISFSFLNNDTHAPPPPRLPSTPSPTPQFYFALPWVSWKIWEHKAALLLPYTRDTHQYHISIVIFRLACHGIWAKSIQCMDFWIPSNLILECVFCSFFAVIVFLGKGDNLYEGMSRTQDYEFTEKVNNA